MVVPRQVLPYAPPSTTIEIIRRFRDRNLPDELSIQFLVEVGVPEGNAHRVMAALRFLALVDEFGVPSPAFHSLQTATDMDYPQLLQSLIRTAYQDVFNVIDPAKDNEVIIANHFRRYQPVSQRSRMVTFFLGMCREAGIGVLEPPRQRSTKQAIAGPRQKVSVSVTEARRPVIRTDVITGTTSGVSATVFTNPRDQYIAALIEAVRQMTARGEVPPSELLDRIERLLEEKKQLEMFGENA